MAITKIHKQTHEVGWLMFLIESEFGPIELIGKIGDMGTEEVTHYIYRLKRVDLPEGDTEIDINIQLGENGSMKSSWKLVNV